MPKKKVLILITKATWGGAQRYVFDLATNLSKDRFEVVVAYGEGGRLRDELQTTGIPLQQISALQRDVAFLSDIRSFFQIRDYIRKMRPDVVHLNSSKAAAIGALAARVSGVGTIIFTVHGWPFNEPRNIISRSLIFIVSWITALLSTRIILVSRRDEAQTRNIPGTGGRSVYIPIGIENTEDMADAEAQRYLLTASNFGAHLERSAQWEEFKKYKLILSVAELTKNKGLTYGIEAIAELRRRGRKDFLYFIAGSGEMNDQLREVIATFNLQKHVFLLGFIPDVAKYLGGCDIFLLPSVKEGLPYVLLEAASARRPIIASDVGGVGDVLEKYDNGILVPPRSPAAIADAILKIEGAPASAEEKIVQQSFGLRDMVRKTSLLYGSES